ncbi:Uncharacterised protein [Vibrio cholerae]|nr:Uncharacterised protein [Vibrio cholerae]
MANRGHIDEVDHHKTTEVTQTQLACDFICSF